MRISLSILLALLIHAPLLSAAPPQPSSKTLDWLCLLQSKDSEEQRRAAAYFASEHAAMEPAAQQEIGRALLQALAAGEAELKALITKALGSYARIAGPEEAPLVIKALAELLSAPQEQLRPLAALALADYGPRARQARPALARAIADPNPATSDAALRAVNLIVREQVPPLARWGFLILALSGLLPAVLVHRIDRKRRVALHVIASLAMLCLVAKAALAFLPSLSLRFDGFPAFVYFEREIALPFALIFFSTAARIIDETRNRRALLGLLAFLFCVYVGQSTWLFSTPDCYVKSQGIWKDGVCLQSTSYTCGAASVATLLRANGVLDAVEHEAAALAHTIPLRVGSDLGAAMALRRKLPGRTITIRLVSVDELDKVTTPCLAPLEFSFWFDHMTVLLAVDDEGFWIGDPLAGRVRFSRKTLERRWLGRIITVE